MFESMRLKVNFKKTKVMVSDLKAEILWSKVNLCSMCGKRVMTYLVLSTKCGE